jgi:hypothetical protein
MAYQEFHAPSDVLSREMTATRNVFNAIGAFFANLGSSTTFAGSAQKRFDQVQMLQSKSDAELAALNIARDDIVHHVFKDLYYI